MSNKQKIRQYFSGFLKGLKLLVLYFCFIGSLYGGLGFYMFLTGISFKVIMELFRADIALHFVSWLIGVVFVGYVVKKNKLENYWILPGLLISAYLTPFLVGIVELRKSTKR